MFLSLESPPSFLQLKSVALFTITIAQCYLTASEVKRIYRKSSMALSIASDGIELYIPLPSIYPKPNLLTPESFVRGMELLGMSDT